MLIVSSCSVLKKHIGLFLYTCHSLLVCPFSSLVIHYSFFLLFFVLLFLKLIFYVTMQGCASVVTLTTVYFPIALDLE